MITFKSNIDDLINRLKKIGVDTQTVDYSAALLLGVNASMAEMKFRIFDDGLDANGNTLGKYVGKKTLLFVRNTKEVRKNQIAEGFGFTNYEKKRLRNKLFVDKKDLEFTGGLRRGIVTVTDSNVKVSCAIPNDELFIIARGQEEQVGRVTGTGDRQIFNLSESEKETMNENIKEGVKQLYEILLK